MKQNLPRLEAAKHELSTMILPYISTLSRIADRWLENNLKQHDISLAEFRIVGILLGEHAGLSQRELAKRLGVRAATVSGALPRLEHCGMVERIANPNDARAKLVRLSDTKKEISPVIAIVGELDNLLFGTISMDDQARLREMLSTALRHIKLQSDDP